MKDHIVHGCVFKYFDSAALVARSASLRRRRSRRSLVDFDSRGQRYGMFDNADGNSESVPLSGWDLLIAQHSSYSVKILGDAGSDAEYVVAGLKEALSILGRRDIEIPENAAERIGRSLSYRLPVETWDALHSLGGGLNEAVAWEMAFILHDGRIRRRGRRRPQLGRGHLLLPAELVGEERFGFEVRDLMRMLPCLGMDRGMERPGEYGIQLAYEDEGAVDSLEYVPLMEVYRKARSRFVQKFELSSESDLVGFIEAYGRSCKLLGKEAAAAFQDTDFVRDTARQVILRGPGRIIPEW